MAPGLQLFINIEQAYGVEVLNMVRKWEVQEINRGIVREQLRFCTICSNRRILPKFTNIMSSVNNRRAREIAVACGRRLLKCAIAHLHSTIQRLGKEIKEHKEQVTGKLDWVLLAKFEDKISGVSRAKASKKRFALDQKLERLVDNEKKGSDRWVRNFSSKPFSEAENRSSPNV
ncbi:uncharacterized protein LOC143036087 [Oratosquilla oratoria]|uniref:uncharacterized protein LOC143036087 n=1 Tax=Oratosquilla oratoria TaxID=337810 RepID=UPI003F7668B0